MSLGDKEKKTNTFGY